VDELSFRDVYRQTYGLAESLTPDDHSALFTLGRMETCRRLNEDACRKLRWLHQNGVDMGCFLVGPERSDCPTCVISQSPEMK